MPSENLRKGLRYCTLGALAVGLCVLPACATDEPAKRDDRGTGQKRSEGCFDDSGTKRGIGTRWCRPGSRTWDECVSDDYWHDTKEKC